MPGNEYDDDHKLTMDEQRKGTEEYFKNGTDYGAKIKKGLINMMGISDPEAEASERAQSRKRMSEKLYESSGE